MRYSKLLLILMISLNGSFAWANANSCDDYLSRHYKQDLVLTSVSFINQSQLGGFTLARQTVRLRIKNSGQVTIQAQPGDSGGYRQFKVKIRNRVYNTRIRVPLASGGTTMAHVVVRGRALRHCKNVNVTLDVGKTFGQWGCQVWNNDVKRLLAHERRKLACFKKPIYPIAKKRRFSLFTGDNNN